MIPGKRVGKSSMSRASSQAPPVASAAATARATLSVYSQADIGDPTFDYVAAYEAYGFHRRFESDTWICPVPSRRS